jgi:hypothetical protein
MNPNTGSIATFETDDDAEQAGHTVPLTKKLAGRLLQVPRQERAAMVLNISRQHPLGRLPGLTDEDLGMLRNAAKRARKLRRG